MGKLKRLFLVLVMPILLTSCAYKKSVTAYTVVGESITKDSNTVLLCDGEKIIKYDRINNEIVSEQVNMQTEVKPSIYLVEGGDYSLSYVRPATYFGTYSDLCGYISHLYNIGFECEKLEATSNYYDIILHNSEYRIRVIYQCNEEIKILCENPGKIACAPPYISGK